MRGAVRTLVVATKAPWPPVDGGRLLLLATLQGLAAAGVRATLVAPVDPRRHDLAAVAAALREWCDPELVPGRPAGAAVTLVRAAAAVGAAANGIAGRTLPLSVARHALPAVRRRVAELLAAGRFDVVHAEQLQALPQALPPARAAGLAVVLRAQNVESALWAAAARGRWPAALEARRLAAWEGRAVAAVDATLALTAIDAAALRQLAWAACGIQVGELMDSPALSAHGPVSTPGQAAALAAEQPPPLVLEVPAPFPAELPAGEAGLDGEPAVVVLGSRGWRPNEDAVAWFSGEVWPAVHRALPAARLHVFGISPPGGAAGTSGGSRVDAAASGAVGAATAQSVATGQSAATIQSAAAGHDAAAGQAAAWEDGAAQGAGAQSAVAWHAAPADSAAAFAAGSIHAVPLRFGSGVRMKILEAWARGVPVVSTPEGAAGLAAADGVELLVAADAAGFTAAFERLRREPSLAAALAAGGRDALRRRHDPAVAADRLLAAYEAALSCRR
jgi:hypothetical protein